MQIVYHRERGAGQWWTVIDDNNDVVAGIQGAWNTGFLVSYGDAMGEERLFETLPAAKAFARTLANPA